MKDTSRSSKSHVSACMVYAPVCWGTRELSGQLKDGGLIGGLGEKIMLECDKFTDSDLDQSAHRLTRGLSSHGESVRKAWV